MVHRSAGPQTDRRPLTPRTGARSHTDAAARRAAPRAPFGPGIEARWARETQSKHVCRHTAGRGPRGADQLQAGRAGLRVARAGGAPGTCLSHFSAFWRGRPARHNATSERCARVPKCLRADCGLVASGATGLPCDWRCCLPPSLPHSLPPSLIRPSLPLHPRRSGPRPRVGMRRCPRYRTAQRPLRLGAARAC